MRESEIERKLSLMSKKRGGIALKFISPSFAGMPDRLLLFPDARCAFVELKVPGQKPRKLQESRHRLLRKLGFKVYVIDDVNMIGDVIDEILTT